MSFDRPEMPRRPDFLLSWSITWSAVAFSAFVMWAMIEGSIEPLRVPMTTPSMGLTPLDGVVMGTRSGSIDPSIIAHMTKALNATADQVMDQLNKKSGLLGISGLSNDMRTLQEAANEGHERAALAIDKFCYSVAKAAAGMIVSLGRVDALVFTGGIGENAVRVRAQVLGLLAFAGFALDPAANELHGAATQGRITRSTSPMAAVVATNEELMIAMDTAEIVARDPNLAARWARNAGVHAVE